MPLPGASQTPSGTTKPKLPTLTIEASRDLERQADRFVISVIVKPPAESLFRWNRPICAVVQGLPPMFDELIRAHISQIALSAHAPVAGKHCTTDLYVFATDDPALLLKELLAHNPRMFDTPNALGSVGQFLHSRLPVRVWYNTEVQCPAGSMYSCSGGSNGLSYGAVSSIYDEYIVVDMRRMTKITTRQLADYIAMVGLADVRPDAHVGTVPTILRLFEFPNRPPQGLSRFRKAAEQGDAVAQSSLGLAYARGQGVPRNYAEAAQWFRRAAEHGDAEAQFDLGIMYANGQGVPRDPVSAYKWWLLCKADSISIDRAHGWSIRKIKESASQMTTDQVARAQREASEWLAAHQSARAE